jgi:hypothetical protein
MKKILFTIASLFITGCAYQPFCYFDGEDVTNMYSSYVEEWQKEAKVAFDSAEKEIFIVAPKPDDIIGPDPDPKKCACKGTGIIVHGDDHETPCPFHSGQKQKVK